MAKFGLDEISDAAASFLEALQYNPEDDKAIAHAAMGYVFQKDYTNAEKFIEQALKKNPASGLAYSLRVQIAPVTESIESVLEKIPPAYHENLDVLVALGDAALKRRLYDKAEKYLQAALNSRDDSSMNRVKVVLGVVLIEPIAQNYLLIAFGQLLDSQKHSLELAIDFFTEVIGGLYTNPNGLSNTQFNALVNRAGALRLLGKYDEAIRDIEMARQKKPEDSYLIKQRTLLAKAKRDEAGAYSYAQQILLSPETPEAYLLAAHSLIVLKRLDEAEDILNQCLLTDSPDNIKREVNGLKFGLFLERGNRKDAEEILQEISNEDPESIFTLIHKIQWQNYIGSEEKISALVEQAKAALAAQTSLAKLQLADILYSLNYYRDAAEVYEQFVDQTLNTELSQKLLKAYYLAGNYKEALNLCQQLLDKHSTLPTVSQIAAYIHHNIGNLDSARQICENYLNIFSDDITMRLRLATVNYATGEYDKLDKFLDSRPNTENLDFASFKKLAQLYKVRNRIDSFLEAIYEIRRRFYNEGQAHVFYQISYFEVTNSQPNIQSFETVKDGCGVLLRNGKEQWYILEDRPDAELARYELNSRQPLYQALIGKNLGDEIIHAEDQFGRDTLKITAITDKYCAAVQLSLSVLQKYPNLKNFRMVTLPMEGDNLYSDWVQQFIEVLQRYKEDFDLFKSDYTSGKIPFGTVAVLSNRHPIEIWQCLGFGSDPFIHAWSNFQYEKFKDALLILQKGGFVIIDPISLITIHHLGVADETVKILGKLGISQSVIDLFQAMVEKAKGWQREGFMTLAVEDGQAIKQEFTPEQISQQKKFFEQIINWINNNCLVLPCYRALDINRDERTKLNEHIGSAFIDTILIAEEPGRILYSDDQWLRWYAWARSSVPGIWTQVVLKYCLVQQSSNEFLYRKATLRLAIHGYTYTIIDAGTLVEAAKSPDGQWQLQPNFTLALKALANKNTHLKYAVSVAADFLRQLYLEFVITNAQLIDPRDGLVFELLKILTAQRSVTDFVQNLKRAIQQKFEVIPLQKQEVIRVIDAWLCSKSFIT